MARRREKVHVSAHNRGWPKVGKGLNVARSQSRSSKAPRPQVPSGKALSSHANRGRDAERVFESGYQDKAIVERDSRGHDFRLTFHNGLKWYVDVKRVEQSVSGGHDKNEPGRVQIEKSELERWLEIEREEDRTSWLVVAVEEGNSFKWRRIRAKEVVPLVQDKQDPYKLTMAQIETFEEFSL